MGAGKLERTVQISNCVSLVVLVFRVRLFCVITVCCPCNLLRFKTLKLMFMMFMMSWQPNID